MSFGKTKVTKITTTMVIMVVTGNHRYGAIDITGNIRCDTIDIAGNNQWVLLISQEIRGGYY